MKSSLSTTLSVLALSAVLAGAAVDPEMEGMEAVNRDDGTFLVGGPTYFFDHILGAGGIHSGAAHGQAGSARMQASGR